MSPVVGCLVGLFVLTYGAVAVFALRHRQLGRLAVREAVRRKGQTLLVVTGLMVGTATITAALVAADSVEDSSLDTAVRTWGLVDLTVTGGDQFFPKDVADRLAAAPGVAGVTDGVSPGIDLAGSVSDLDTRQGASTITLVGFDSGAQEPFGAYVLTTGRRTLGQDLPPGEVLLSRVLADKLGARPGDRIHVRVDTAASTGGAPVDLRVAGIARSEGPGGYTLGSVVFAPLGTAQRIAGTPLINIVRISATGGSRDSVAAIRDLPEPPAEAGRRPWVRRVGLAISAAVGAVALVRPYFPRLAGGLALILVLSSLARPRLSQRTHATLTGLALAGWSLAMIGTSHPNADPGAFILVFVVAMLASVFGLTILAAANLPLVETTVGLVDGASAGLRAILRPPLAYLSRRPVRTGLTTGVFAVTVAMLTLFAVFYVINRPAYERFGNGYDVRVQSTGSATVQLPAAVRADVTRSVTLPTRGHIGRVTGGDEFSTAERAFLPLFQVEPNMADDPPVRLGQRDHRFGTDRAVWQALVRDPSLVVANLGTPGQTLTLQGRDGPVTFTIVGSQPSGLLDGVFGTERALAPFRAAAAGATMLLDLRDAGQADALARTVERELFDHGVDAEPVQALLDQTDRANRALLLVIDVLMRMGLVVGILGLGIVSLRIVTERRQVIGILRAIGYKRRSVILALLTESAVTATIGTAVGIAAGITTGYLFYRQSDSQPGFGIDLASIGGVLGLLYLAVLLVTLGPAWKASRLPPAEAVRYTE